MKKILLAALAALTLVGTANAAGTPVARYMKYEQLFFRSQVAANPVSQWDSLTTSRVGAAGASGVLDTTLAISTEGWEIPGGSAAGDSAIFAHLMVYDATVGGDCESGADSLAAAVQVSADGVTWITVPALAGQVANAAAGSITSRNNQTIANGAFMDVLSSNGAALALGQPLWSFPIKFRGSGAPYTVDNGRVALFPFIRFILNLHDAKAYILNAKVGHFQSTLQ